jgi:hypothetical protein
MTRAEEKRLVAALRGKQRLLKRTAKAYGRKGYVRVEKTYVDRSDGVFEAILALEEMFEKGRRGWAT